VPPFPCDGHHRAGRCRVFCFLWHTRSRWGHRVRNPTCRALSDRSLRPNFAVDAIQVWYSAAYNGIVRKARKS